MESRSQSAMESCSAITADGSSSSAAAADSSRTIRPAEFLTDSSNKSNNPATSNQGSVTEIVLLGMGFATGGAVMLWNEGRLLGYMCVSIKVFIFSQLGFSLHL